MNISGKIFVISMLSVILAASVISYEGWINGYSRGQLDGYIQGINTGYVKGQNDTLTNVEGILAAGGIVFNWTQQPNGDYIIQVLRVEGSGIMSEVASISATSFNILNMSGLIGDNHKPPVISVNLDWVFQIADGASVREIEGSSGNLITDIGDQFISNITSGRTMTSYTYTLNGTYYLALGNGTNLAYADTQLTTECALADTGFKRTTALTPTYATGTGIGNGYHFNFTITNKFTATQADTINATSAHWSGVAVSNNNMMAEASIGTLPVGQAFAINDNCTIAYTFTFEH